MDRPAENLIDKLLADLSPEELEPRLELQVFHDTLFAAACENNNAHGSTRVIIDHACTNNNL